MVNIRNQPIRNHQMRAIEPVDRQIPTVTVFIPRRIKFINVISYVNDKFRREYGEPTYDCYPKMSFNRRLARYRIGQYTVEGNEFEPLFNIRFQIGNFDFQALLDRANNTRMDDNDNSYPIRQTRPYIVIRNNVEGIYYIDFCKYFYTAILQQLQEPIEAQ